jgi:hypothetical protein
MNKLPIIIIIFGSSFELARQVLHPLSHTSSLNKLFQWSEILFLSFPSSICISFPLPQ